MLGSRAVICLWWVMNVAALWLLANTALTVCLYGNKGRLAPGDKRIFQLTFQAGLAPQLFSGEVYCYARQEQGDDHPSTDGAVLLQCIDDSKQALCTAACSGPQNLDGGDLQEDQEEVFAEHPVR